MSSDTSGLSGPLHCISLPAQTGRRERLARRAAHHGIDLRIVDAVQPDSPLVEYYLEGSDPASVSDKRRREVACLASHLLAIRTAMARAGAGQRGVLIGEDDIIPHDRWAERVRLLADVLPAEASLCCLGYLLDPAWELPDGPAAESLNPDEHAAAVSVLPIERGVVLGTQLYWLSLDYAADVLASLDAPVRHLPAQPTAELITTRSRGYFVVPPLVIEEALDSDIRGLDELRWHSDAQARWSVDEYLAAEDDDSRAQVLQRARTDQ